MVSPQEQKIIDSVRRFVIAVDRGNMYDQLSPAQRALYDEFMILESIEDADAE